MSVNLSNIFRRCSVFHNILQYRIKQSSNLIVCTRKLHLGLFMKENNLFQRAYLLSSVGITDIAKRNATKKAKGKKKVVVGGGGGGSNRIDLSVGADAINLREIQDGMIDVTTKLADEFTRRFAPKLTANILDNIPVKISGSMSPLFEVGEVKSHETEFIIEPSTEESQNLIMDALKKELNVDPMIVGPNIRIPVSIASTEYKENILKLSKASAEKSKVEIRKIRQLAMNISKKHGGSKDKIKLIDTQIQNLTDKFSHDVENMVVQKKLELNPGKDPRKPSKIKKS